MKNLISIEVDALHGVGYVSYREGVDPKEYASTIPVAKYVVADLDALGDVMGIELLALDAETLAAAQAYATEMGLAFPRDLRAALPTG